MLNYVIYCFLIYQFRASNFELSYFYDSKQVKSYERIENVQILIYMNFDDCYFVVILNQIELITQIKKRRF